MAEVDNMFKFGPQGMQGEIWDEKGRGELVEILISHQQDIINSIRFTYRTASEKLIHSTHGEPNGLKFNMVEINFPNENLTSVSGEYKDGKLASIVFGTNYGKYGPFGRAGNRASSSSYDDFEYKFIKGRFGGFHGSVKDGSVYAIGVYVKPYRISYQDDFYDPLLDDLF